MKTVNFIFGTNTNDKTGIEVTSVIDDVEAKQLELAENENDKPLKVQIKDNKFQDDKIIEYQGEETKLFEFRPQTWEQFISQTEAKEQAKTIKKIINTRRKKCFTKLGVRWSCKIKCKW